VHIDVDPRILAGQWAPAEVRLTADARLAISSLLQACEDAGVQPRARWWADASAAESDEQPSTTLALIRQIAAQIDQILPDDGVVTSDAGDFYLGCAPMLSFHGERRYLGPTSGTMGYGLPAAVGAKLAAPERVCVALCGDGGLMMSVQELETAVRYDVPVVVVVFNNNAYGSIVRHQQTRFDGRMVGTALGNPPFAELAELFGAHGTSVGTADEFGTVFKEAAESGRVEVIEVRL
jgi:acetolactate synthase-1/2/3 large subunit